MTSSVDDAGQGDGPAIFYVTMCQPCIRGEGSECHTPECAFFLKDVPAEGCNDAMTTPIYDLVSPAEHQEALDRMALQVTYTEEGTYDVLLRLREMRAATKRVRALHSQSDDLLAPGKWCPACGEESPCSTIRALDGER